MTAYDWVKTAPRTELLYELADPDISDWLATLIMERLLES